MSKDWAKTVIYFAAKSGCCSCPSVSDGGADFSEIRRIFESSILVAVFSTGGLNCQPSPKLCFFGLRWRFKLSARFDLWDLWRDSVKAQNLLPKFPNVWVEKVIPHSIVTESLFWGHLLRFRCRFPKPETQLKANVLFLRISDSKIPYRS
jgi:hypothetical protein